MDNNYLFVTVSSDDTAAVGDANVFSNELAVPIRFPMESGVRVEVALFSIIYNLTAGSETVYHVNTNLVPATQHVGSKLTNSIRQVRLVADGTDKEWNTTIPMWLPAQVNSDGMSLIQVQMSQPNAADATGFNPKTDLVFAFRTVRT